MREVLDQPALELHQGARAFLPNVGIALCFSLNVQSARYQSPVPFEIIPSIDE